MNKLIHIPPPFYALLILFLCHQLSVLLPLPIDLSVFWLGTGATAIAVGLVLWAWLNFLRSRTTPIPTGTPSALVITGPYRWTRNPMYLGLVIALVSAPLFAGSPWYLLAAPAFWYVVDRLIIPFEESRLSALFGAEYQAFAQTVRRWL